RSRRPARDARRCPLWRSEPPFETDDGEDRHGTDGPGLLALFAVVPEEQGVATVEGVHDAEVRQELLLPAEDPHVDLARRLHVELQVRAVGRAGEDRSRAVERILEGELT